jgi:hypothetical protein
MGCVIRSARCRPLRATRGGKGGCLSAFVAAWALATTGSASAAAPVIAAAGDIACDPGSPTFNGGNGTLLSCRDQHTSDLLVNDPSIAAVLPLGDNQYYCGGFAAFQASYDLSWGRLKSISHPSVGNHEYLTSGGTGCHAGNTGAAGYFKYFGAAAGEPNKGYYSYDVGSWHLIALNSQCGAAGGCESTSQQGQWLRADLAAHANQCLLAYWHIPLFSSGGSANTNSRPFWDALYAAKADVILTAHDHIYERFAPQTPTRAADPVKGIREFVVGTGGSNHTSLAALAANSEILNTDTFGVLELTLYPDHYTWQFVPEAGGSFTDAGSQSCHKGAVAQAEPPSAPVAPGAGTSLGPSGSTDPTSGPTPVAGPDSIRPVLSATSLSRAVFRAAPRGPSVSAVAVGTQVRYKLSEAATAHFRVQRLKSGRYVGLRGGFTHAGKAGANRFKFTGRLGGRRLKPARYRLVQVAVDATGNKSATKRVRFRIVA